MFVNETKDVTAVAQYKTPGTEPGACSKLSRRERYASERLPAACLPRSVMTS